MINNKVIIILGQTSTGKSDFAVEIAKQVNGEIISADSRQVYIGMDLGTGKITKKEMRGVPHHLLDILSPNKTFTVNDFQKIANKKIEEIIKKGKVPIICGGTGFYIDAVVDGTVFPNVPPNKKLREELSKKSSEELLKILIKLDKDRAENIDINNGVRLIRAIEIAKSLGSVPKTIKTESKYQFLKVGLKLQPVSPHGNGLDCFRTWEAIYLGCIPIVKTSMIDDLYDNLPVLIVKDWSDITRELLEETLIWYKENVSLFCFEKLKLSYWIEKIYSYKNENL